MRRLLLALTVLTPAVGLAATGGPDGGGYTWADQEEPGITGDLPTTTFSSLSLGADEVSAPVDLGFSFPFYGNTYTQVVISSNGWLSFDTSLTNSHRVPSSMPDTGAPNDLIAWYWRDLDAPTILRFGAFPGGMRFLIRTTIPGQTSPVVQANILLFNNGSIKIVYSGTNEPTTAVVGVENAAGTEGNNPWDMGTAPEGFILTSGAIIQWFPPPGLSCASMEPITCGATISSTTTGLTNGAIGYLCASDQYLGNEKVFTLDLAGLNDVTVDLVERSGADLDVFILRDQCNEFGCLDGGSNQASLDFASPGLYHIVVDGKTAADVGDFDISVSCTPKSAVLNCGDMGVAGMTSGATQWERYPCTNANLSGPEFIYEIPFTSPGNIKVRLDAAQDMDLIAFGPDVFDAPDGCIGYGAWNATNMETNLTLFDPPDGTYFVMVDGKGGASGSYTVDLSCDVELDCSAPAGDLQCFVETAGTTTGLLNNVELYSCSPERFDGGEIVYRFFNDRERTLSFIYDGPPDTVLFLVADTCNEGGCIETGEGRLVARDLPTGNYFVVVDGRNGASGDFTIQPVCENIINPPTGTWTLDPGASVSETKDTTINADLSRGDVLFAMDLTGSMGTALDNLKVTTEGLINDLATVIDDVQFGLVSYEDYPTTIDHCFYNAQYGVATDAPYRLNLPITNDLAQLFTAIDDLQLGNGADIPESYTRVFFESYSDPNIAWREGSKRIVIGEGDAIPHSCATLACGAPRQNSGVDPGRDEVNGTADDLEMDDVMTEMRTQGIVPLFLFTGDPSGDFDEEWECWTSIGGGDSYLAPLGLPNSEIAGDIVSLIESKSLLCEVLEVTPSPGFETWMTNVVGSPQLNVSLPTETQFSFDIGPPAGTSPGVYVFTVDVVCDGLVKVSQDVTITVSGVCTPPTGAVANALFAVRQGNDVFLEWRNGPTNPRNYNIHRETGFASRTNICSDPPANPARSQASNDEIFTDLGVVDDGNLYYYQVYARDCDGLTVVTASDCP